VATVRGLDWLKEAFLRASEQPIDQSFVGRVRPADYSVDPGVNTFHLELLAGFDAVQLPEFRRQYDSTFGG
jgi:hypothetical protein